MPVENILKAALILMGVVLCCSSTLPSTQGSSDFLVQIRETKTDLSPNGGVTRDCILVQQNGRFHLERRRQQLPNPDSKLTVFESRLSRQELQKLHTILDEETIQRLPEFTHPARPIGALKFLTFSAKVVRGSETQRSGYFAWDDSKVIPQGTPGSTPDDAKKAWKESELALGPLAKWFKEIKALHVNPSNKTPTLCLTPDEEEN